MCMLVPILDSTVIKFLDKVFIHAFKKGEKGYGRNSELVTILH